MSSLNSMASDREAREAARAPLQVSPILCVFARQGDGDTPLCERVCPTKAIRVEAEAGSGPMLQSNACVECRLCTRACPTGAFEDAAPDAETERAIRWRLRQSHDLTFRCAGHHPARGSSRESDPGGAVVVPCLGAVSTGSLVLIAALGGRSVCFDDRNCSGCTWRRGLVLTRRAAMHARRILALYEREIQMLWSTRVPAPAEIGISRREFFKSVRQTCPPEDLPSASDAGRSTLRRPPRDRLLLAQAMSLLGAPRQSLAAGGEASSLWALAADETCDACGVCAALCPTEALRFRETAGEAAILLRMLFCTGCGLCIQRCPRGALDWRSTIPTASLVDPRWITLARAVRERCETCGAQVSAGGAGRVCADCRLKRVLAASFANVSRDHHNAGRCTG